MRKNQIRTVRSVFRFPVLRRLKWYLIPYFIYGGLVAALNYRWPAVGGFLPRHASEAVLTGILFGWLMNFRANVAQSRWWEGRVLWGQLVNESRNLSLKSTRLLSAPGGKRMTTLLVQFAETLRDHLRRPPGQPHAPLHLASQIHDVVATERASGKVDGFSYLSLDGHVSRLMDICGGCERIRNTPLSTSYRGLIRKGIVLYLALLPWLLVDDLDWITPFVATLIGYALIGLELIAGSIEDPFGLDGDDLPLDDLVEVIRRGVCQVTAEDNA